jgi:hypothetical protein
VTSTCQLPWNALEQGFKVLMKDGYPWTVDEVAEDLSTLTVSRDGRPPLTRPIPEGDAKVVLDARTAAKLEQRAAYAEDLLRERLGAERVALGDPKARVLVEPVQWVNEADLRMHLRFMHGMYEADVKTVDGEYGLLAMHDYSHDKRDTPYYIPHIHYNR